MQKIKTNKTPLLLVFLLPCLVSFFAVSIVGLHSLHARAYSAEFTQSYNAKQVIASGAVVSLVSGDANTVELATLANASRTIGVYVAQGATAFGLDSSQKGNVATSGRAMALVSDIYGAIKNGDLLTVSKIDGVAAKNMYGGALVGTALSDFSSASAGVAKQEITKSDGSKQEISLGEIPVLVSIGVASGKTTEPGIKGLLESIVGKGLSDAQVVMVVFVAVLVIVVLTVLVANAIRSAIISVGRNPMAKPAIFEALAKVMLMVVLIAILGVAVIYVILRL